MTRCWRGPIKDEGRRTVDIELTRALSSGTSAAWRPARPRLRKSLLHSRQSAWAGLGTCGQADGTAGADTLISVGDLIPLDGIARGFWIEAPVTTGDDVTLTFAAEPGDAAVLLFTADIMPGIDFPSSQVALHLSLPVGDVPLGSVGLTGTLTFDVDVPPLPVRLEGVGLAAQALYSSGGETFLSEPSWGVFVSP